MARPGRLERLRKKRVLLERYGNRCWWCGELFTDDDPPTIEHVVPQAQGGTWRIKNLRLTHSHCNQSRGNNYPFEGEI